MTVPPHSQPSAEPPPEDGAHVGAEDDPRRELAPRVDPPVAPPAPYQADGALQTPPTTIEPTTMDRIISASWPLATAVFILLGFTTGRWYLVWVVFLIPAALKAWHRPGED